MAKIIEFFKTLYNIVPITVKLMVMTERLKKENQVLKNDLINRVNLNRDWTKAELDKIRLQYKMAVDISQRQQRRHSGGNWAVIALPHPEGKADIVEFIHLPYGSAEEVKRFLRDINKRYSVNNRDLSVDGPFFLPKDYWI